MKQQRKNSKQKNKSNKKIKKNNNVWMKLVGASATVVVLGAAYVGSCKVIGEDQVIWENTAVNGVVITDLTTKEAEEAVQEKFTQTYQDTALHITLDGQEYSIPVFSMLEIHPEEEIEKAYELGHGHWLTRGVDWVRKELGQQMQKEITVEPTVVAPELLDGLIESSGILGYNSTKESSYEMQEHTLVIHKGKAGKSADVEKLKESILQALEKKDFDTVIDCPYTEHAYGDLVIQDIAGEIQREVADAGFNKETEEVIPSQEGISMDIERAVEIYNQTAEGADAVIELTVTKPEISTEDMEANLFTTAIGDYSTNGGGTSNRRSNISLAVKAIHNKVLLPGETFSYNDTLGKRTKEKGYKEAGAYADGSVVQEVGGGICQVSSTLFAAVLETNLEIVQRRNHSMTVSYMPMGLDATVSWGGPDLKFKNNRKYPIKIAASYNGGKIYVEILGANETDTTTKVTTKATGDMSVDTYRNVYDASGALISEEKVCSSRYRPKTTPTPIPTPVPQTPPQDPATPPQDPATQPQDPATPPQDPATPPQDPATQPQDSPAPQEQAPLPAEGT